MEKIFSVKSGIVFFTFLSLFLAGYAVLGGSSSIPAEVLKLHQEAIVCDLHADTQFMITYMGFNIAKYHHTFDFGPAGVAPMFSDIDIPRLREGGVDMFTMAICPSPKNNKTPGAAAFVRRSLNKIDKVVEANRKDLAIAHSPEELRQIVASGRIAMLLAVEGGSGIENSIDILHEFYNRGVRYMTVTHAKNLDWAASGGDKDNVPFEGLTEFGRQVLREMEKMHMMIDLAHASEKTFWATLEAVKCPVIVTHTAARALSDHPRNLTDEQIKAVAGRGDVVGVIFYDKYLDVSGKKPKDVGLIVDHIDYIKKIAGIDVIALGSDYDGDVIVPPDIANASRYPALTAELVRRGYTDEEIKKILGENFLRAWARIIEQN